MLNDHIKIKLKCYLAAIFAAMLVYLVFHSLINLQQQKYQSDEFLASAAYGNLLRTEVDRELNSLLFISNGIASYITVYKDELEPTKLQAILEDLWHRAKHVRNLGVAVGYKLTYVYPARNNSKIIGVDFRNLPDQWPKVKQAVDSKKGVLDGPIQLIQGGRGIVYRYPIFIEDDYWGIISTVIDTDEFLKAAFRNTLKDHHEFAIRSAGKKEVFYGDPTLFTDDGIFRQISLVPDGQWEWAIKTPTSHFHTQVLIFRILSIIISLLLGLMVYFFLRERYRLSEYAMLDTLTRLPNRRLLNDRMEMAFYTAKRFNKLMAIMAIDVDHFKRINDTYGHDFGDEVLRGVADTISETLRVEDTVSRVGGDEFIVLLKEVNSVKNVTYIAEKLKTTFSKPVTIFGQDILVQLSIGIAIYNPDHHSTLKQLCKEADIALYQAKANGRNGHSVFGESTS
jgi:diguanylate cyclase (GGDEF)-like protein